MPDANEWIPLSVCSSGVLREVMADATIARVEERAKGCGRSFFSAGESSYES